MRMPALVRRLLRARLWIKLAAFAAVGVVAMHAGHLAVTTWITGEALAREQEAYGRGVARLVAQQSTDAILLDDAITLNELVADAVTGGDVAYCFIVRDGRVLASSFAAHTPPALVAVRNASDSAPFFVTTGGGEYLDIVEPVLDGRAAVVRIGIDTSLARSTSRDLGVLLTSLAAAMIVAGVAAALVVGRSIARPVGEILHAADHFDPANELRALALYGTDEFADIARRFNQMMVRLKEAHDEQARTRQKQAETERMVALGLLVGGVAHEINNPLAGMMNCLEALRSEDLTDDKRREYFALMAEGLDRIQDTVQRLLDFTRRRELSLAPVFASDLAREACRLVRPVLHERHIKYREELEGIYRNVRVVADTKQVTQALLNLILNALYVTPRDGEIVVRLRRRPGFAGLSVEDRGPGIPEEVRGMVTAPFFTTKPEGEGTGLGLSVTQSIAAAHGGELTFDFPGEGGTRATLWLREAGS